MRLATRDLYHRFLLGLGDVAPLGPLAARFLLPDGDVARGDDRGGDDRPTPATATTTGGLRPSCSPSL